MNLNEASHNEVAPEPAELATELASQGQTTLQPNPLGVGPRIALHTTESLIALALCVLFTMIGGLVVVPFTIHAEFPLESAIWSETTESDASATETLLAEIDRVFEGSGVSIVSQAPDNKLRLEGFASLSLAEAQVHPILRKHGFAVAPARPHPALDVTELQKGGRLMMMFGWQSLMFLVFGALLSRFRNQSLGFSRQGALSAGALGIGIGGAAFLVSAGLALLHQVLGFPIQEQEEMRRLLGEAKPIQLLPWVVLIVPFVEEVFFRGYIFRLIEERARPWMAYGVSGALFATAHLNFSAFLIYFTVGVLFAYAYARTRNMWAPVLAHMTYNGVVFAISQVADTFT